MGVRKTKPLTKPTQSALLPAFEVGEPLNGRLWKGVPYCVGIESPCRDERRAYDGSDPQIQFPKDWHTNTGARAGGGLQQGGYHQYLPNFEPDRVRVENGVVRVLAGMPGRHGGAEVTRPLDSPVTWESGQSLRLVAEFMPTDEVSCPMFDNLELRGLRVPAGKPHAEPALVFGFLLSSTKRSAYWWHDRSDTSPLGDRRTVTQLAKIAIGKWHRLVVTLTPSAEEYQWDLTLRLRIDGKLEWEFEETTDSPNGAIAVRSVMFGNEHSLARNQIGGVWLYRKMQAYVIANAGAPH